MHCQYCEKFCKNSNSLLNHERLCKNNPNRAESSFVRFKKDNPDPWNKGLIGAQSAWNKGKTIDGHPCPEAQRVILSEKMKAKYAAGWDPKAGRCKKYSYSSKIAGDIKVDGTWELTFCKYADAKGLKWERNTQRFGYVTAEGKCSTYKPDFFVCDWNSFVEIKGYETDLDHAKWSQFPKDLNLIVLRRKEIGELDEWLKSAPC